MDGAGTGGGQAAAMRGSRLSCHLPVPASGGRLGTVRFQLALLLATAPALAGCAEQAAPASTPPIQVELVEVKQGMYEPRATYRVVNTSDRVLAYQGGISGVPVSRLAVLFEGEWLEDKPAWVDCATGREICTLQPGAEATFEVRTPRPDLPIKVGVGAWEPVEGEPPAWNEWSWAWSRRQVLDDVSNQTDG